MRPKTREMTQHGGPPGWLEESDPAGWDLSCDGQSMPPYRLPQTGAAQLQAYPTGPAVHDLTRDGRLSTYDESVLKLSKVSFWGKCARTGHPLKLPSHQQNSPGCVIFLKLASPVFCTISFLWLQASGKSSCCCWCSKVVMNVHKTSSWALSRKEGKGQNSS